MQKITLLLIGLLFSCVSPILAQDVTNDAKMVLIKMDNYGKYGEYPVRGVFKNNGSDNLTSIVINWQIDNGAVHPYNKNNFDIRKGQSWFFLHPDKAIFDETKDYVIKIWLSSPNEATDENHDNDTLYKTIQVIEEFPEKHFLIEEVTGAWCGYCPRGPIIFNKVVKPAYPKTLLVAIHTGDAMTSSSATSVMNEYVTGIPTGFVSREAPNSTVALAPEQWKNTLNDLDPDFTPVDINIYNYYDTETREWKIDVVADFVLDYSGDMRMNCYIIEDSLSGTGNQWAQRNYFNGSAQDPYMELQGAGDPIPGYVHMHVLRNMLGGSWGKSGIIPYDAKKSNRYVYSQTFTAKSKWNMDNVHILGMVQLFNADNKKRPILNVKEAEVSLKTGIATKDIRPLIRLYPNPVQDIAILELYQNTASIITIQILDSSGRLVEQLNVNSLNNNNIIRINCQNWGTGIYFIKVNGQKTEVLKLIKED